MKPIFPVRYTFDGECYGKPGRTMRGNTVISGRDEASAVRAFLRRHPNLTNVKVCKP